MIFHHVTPSRVSAPFRYPSWVELIAKKIPFCPFSILVPGLCLFLAYAYSCDMHKTPVHNDVAGFRCMTDINCGGNPTGWIYVQPNTGPGERRRTEGVCLGRHRDSTPRPLWLFGRR
ncbi:hypothetical protein NEUTE1DRAFT_102051 [Neurospora tetrasperma FGSC 2508]|uniref:Uncharacterized protein n=1 Tax=Neurospora tetrasperma (strain FGSC 2508 / ATCC MYA-4615 / P0657) TaxID=510951 RepID=F8MR06_NEUT8|nr:uncharacterized protein NEUTE1DRAFT_102051 [Neurospora tetrasperma FGSC 2508]EGO56786.1 hypothetical protein NEUTE1DRAFT_102051 [Neurospora tetrasperma FGSC 2508]